MLFTITGPTASGKTFLRDYLVGHHGFQPLVSTTTRAPRPGEEEGREYYYITKDHSADLMLNGGFIEHFTYNGTTYGITKNELFHRLKSGKPVVAILTPEGVEQFEHHCEVEDIDICTIYVHTDPFERQSRLIARTAIELDDLHTTAGAFNLGKVQAILSTFVGRLTLCGPLGTEEAWRTDRHWDIMVSGEDLNTTINQIINYRA